MRYFRIEEILTCLSGSFVQLRPQADAHTLTTRTVRLLYDYEKTPRRGHLQRGLKAASLLGQAHLQLPSGLTEAREKRTRRRTSACTRTLTYGAARFSPNRCISLHPPPGADHRCSELNASA
jgi:hypothetical protein